jgi:hypothetical protein
MVWAKISVYASELHFIGNCFGQPVLIGGNRNRRLQQFIEIIGVCNPQWIATANRLAARTNWPGAPI